MSLERSTNRLSPVALSESEIANRRIGRILFSTLFRTRIARGRENLQEAADFVKATGKGFAVEINHFSQSDPIHAMLVSTSLPELRNSRIVGPWAAHQIPKRFDLLSIGNRMGIEMFPVITENTIKQAKKRRGFRP